MFRFFYHLHLNPFGGDKGSLSPIPAAAYVAAAVAAVESPIPAAAVVVAVAADVVVAVATSRRCPDIYSNRLPVWPPSILPGIRGSAYHR